MIARARHAARAICLVAALSTGCERERTTAPAPAPPTPPSPPAAAAHRTPAPLPPEAGSLSPNADQRPVDELLREMNESHGPSDAGGRAWLEAPGGVKTVRVEAGGAGRFSIQYEAGPAGIALGGSVHVRIPRFRWSPPQLDQPDQPGHVTVTTRASGVTLETRVSLLPEITVTVQGRALRRGERIRVLYGAGPALASVQQAAERGGRFWILVDGDGDGTAAPLVPSPAFDILPGRATRLLARWPSTARPGDTIRLGVAALDEFWNSTPRIDGTLRLDALPQGIRRKGGGPIGFDAGGVASVELVAEREGDQRMTVRGTNGLSATTNPLRVSDGPRVVWGDLHGHSYLSDASGAPEDYFRYARDVTRMDVSVLTDHDHYGGPLYLDQKPAHWQRIKDTVARMHAPGRFVTLLGFEWTSWLHGHRHVLYFDDDGRVISSLDPATGTPRQLWDALRGQNALTFAHHSAGLPVATNWAYAPDPVLEPLTEIVSNHGSSESADTPIPVRGMIEDNTVRGVLDRGYQLGFVGSNDSHDGRPGCPYDAMEHRCGLVGIQSEDLSRVGILEALRARRTYATNGPRILLRATIDGQPMGSTLPAAGPHTLVIEVVTARPLASIDLLQDDGVIQRVPTLSERELRVERALGPMRPGGYLYVRAVQLDQGAAWSSPFFFR